MNYPYFHFTGGLIAAVLFLVLMFFLLVVLPVGFVTEAFGRLGMTTGQGFLLLLAILVGRAVNIPVYTSEKLVMVQGSGAMRFRFDGMARQIEYEEPVNELKKQVFAVNLGGCVFPVILSIGFLLRSRLIDVPDMPALPETFIWLGLTTAAVAAVCYALTKPDVFTGFRLPILAPLVVTLATTMILVPAPVSPLAAYVGGSLGTLLGANVIPLLIPSKRRELASPLVSIGGAGTFGGVFVAGVAGALLT
ncbi:DUF1614 domain-containing protein [Desulfovibrio oxyclinae]|jgi:uncharacterized membrane protein|uniref:DUF1614 domain-containing protein n=1 Tax=Desulfovibrio oxyclinae TaxID=63560 RepID=UPI00037AE338|nr:DUF1614 domain-containing protein [Desulfovibrio oxyclinae]